MEKHENDSASGHYSTSSSSSKASSAFNAPIASNDASKAFTASPASNASPRILIITYYWPPCGGAGVQRWLKFSKYMPEYGWQPYVLTVDPDYAEYPAIDHSLEKDINPLVRIYKTRAVNYFRLAKKKGSSVKAAAGFATGGNSFKSKIARFIRGNFFIPDPRKGWNRFAVEKAAELIRSEGIEYIVTTSPPHSTQLIGLKLKKQFPDIKWICDLRDPWTDIYYYKKFYPTALPGLIDKKYEKAVFQNADLISMAGNHISQAKIIKYKLDKNKLFLLLNGFDEEDFPDIIINKPSVFTITYAGSISEQYPVSGFVRAVKKILSLQKEIRINFIGHVNQEMVNNILNELPSSAVQFTPYLDHKEAITQMMNSHMLLLIIPDHEKNKSIIPGKLFEYIRTGNPILSIGPKDSDVEKIIDDTLAGKNYESDDIEGIINYITTEIEKKPHRTNPCPEIYNRRNQIYEVLKKISF